MQNKQITIFRIMSTINHVKKYAGYTIYRIRTGKRRRGRFIQDSSISFNSITYYYNSVFEASIIINNWYDNHHDKYLRIHKIYCNKEMPCAYIGEYPNVSKVYLKKVTTERFLKYFSSLLLSVLSVGYVQSKNKEIKLSASKTIK